MRKEIALLFVLVFSCALPSLAQDKPTIVVQPFTLASGVSWPYDMKMLEMQTTAELHSQDAKKYNIVSEAPATATPYLSLRVEVLEWHPGNAAKRALVGMGTGRESAKIRFELTDQNGKRVFEHEDTVRTEFYASAYSSSVGQLAHPLADKIGHRIAEAKIE
jgi:hypothetical protein